MAGVRHNVLKLPAGDQTLMWYGRAIGAMLSRPITDPTSWRFQAAIHDYNRAADPLAVQNESLPSSRIRNRFWAKCEHGSWFFLPWHRLYLYFFEQIVAAEVKSLGGPSDWALPYWNYSENQPSRLLPAAFRNPTLADGSRNFLFVAQRDPRCNAGNNFADARDVALQPSLTQTVFSDNNGVNFGGLPTISSPSSHNARGLGQLEIVPHGLIHNAVGGGQWMSSFNTAGLDPIFWLHHANIDRLWEVWLKRDATHRNPAQLQWRNTSFSFYNASRQIVTMRCFNTVDLITLGYSYEEVGDPLSIGVPAAAAAGAAPEVEVTMADSIPPELVGATETSVKVGNTPARIRVPTPEHTTARRRFAASAEATAPAAPGAAAPQPRVLLQLENLTASGPANSYDVYVNVPENDDPTQHEELFAGRLDLFGVPEASRATNQHPSSGLTYTLDISGIYNQLANAADWSPDNIDVSLVPVRSWEGAQVTVGRVSLFFG
jgi:tyrosinase